MKKTNFRKIIRELVKSGYSDALLAHECGCSQTYITQLSKGHRKQPGYDIGRKLSELHEAIE
jgi:hypothetical protein